jgi:hypothetical protein
MTPSPSRGVLYVIGCAAMPVLDLPARLPDIQARGWDTCLILTPAASAWLAPQLPELEELTGHPVRDGYKNPGDPDKLPPADALFAVPSTVNTINKMASGISDTLALGLLTECIAWPKPIVMMPFTNRAQGGHPRFRQNVADLRSWGVRVLLGDDVMPLREPGQGQPDTFPWKLALDELDSLTAEAGRATG